jgi:hypothetical protein
MVEISSMNTNLLFCLNKKNSRKIFAHLLWVEGDESTLNEVQLLPKTESRNIFTYFLGLRTLNANVETPTKGYVEG